MRAARISRSQYFAYLWSQNGELPLIRHRWTSKRSQELTFPEPGKLRSHKVVTRSRARSAGKYLNAFRVLDSEPTVIRFSEQPCEIAYLQDGVLRSHFPDILVEYVDRKELWEVKLESEATKPEIAARTALLMEHNLEIPARRGEHARGS
jgi:hypothetical protein